MISRYTLPRMGKVWKEEQKFSLWLKIEILACEAWAKLGKIPPEALDKIKKKANFDIKRIKEIESEVKHDVVAFLTNLAEYVGPEARYIHLGLTSSDIGDTCLALQMKMAAQIILQDLDKLAGVLREKARKHKNTLMMGRTHGVHAEPITLGLKFALWYEETKRNLERMRQAKENISCGKISGAVGTYANLEPSVEEYVCKKLDLIPCPVSNQIIQRDRHAQYLSTLAIIASSLDKFALEIRGLQRTEIREVEDTKVDWGFKIDSPTVQDIARGITSFEQMNEEQKLELERKEKEYLIQATKEAKDKLGIGGVLSSIMG